MVSVLLLGGLLSFFHAGLFFFFCYWSSDEFGWCLEPVPLGFLFCWLLAPVGSLVFPSFVVLCFVSVRSLFLLASCLR